MSRLARRSGQERGSAGDFLLLSLATPVSIVLLGLLLTLLF